MDAEYCIMSASELGELTPMEGFILFGASPAYEAIRTMVDNNLEMPDRFMENTARAFLDSTTQQERYYWALRALPATDFGLKLVAERAEGLLRTKVLTDLGIMEEGVSRFMDHFPERRAALKDVRITDGSQVTEQWARNMLNKHFIGFRRRLTADLALAEDAIVWYQQDDGATFRIMQRQQENMRQSRQRLDAEILTVTGLAKEIIQQRKRKAQQQEGYLRRKARAAIKKASELLCNLGQEENLKLFVSGKEVEISNESSPFKFVLRPLKEANWLEQRSLKGHSHTPYDLALLTKDNIHLARLCVYFDETPVLDQLLALTLFVQAGDEQALLSKANWFGFSDVDQARAILEVKAPALVCKLPAVRTADTEMAGQGMTLTINGQTTLIDIFSPQMRKEENAWEPTKDRAIAWINTWFAPVKEQLALLGAQAPHLAAPQ